MKWFIWLLIAVPLCGQTIQPSAVQTPNLDNILFVDGQHYQTCQAAVTAAGSAGLVIVPPGFAGNCSYTPAAGVSVWDFRAAPILSGSINGNVNGAINPQTYGAKCDGVTDDTAAFQNAITVAFPNNGGSAHSLIIPATGNGCVVSQLNLTNINNEINITGQSSISGFQSIIWCRENTSDTKPCLDFTGSQYVSLSNLDLYGGTSAANAPQVTVLLAKSNTGNSQIIHWNDVTVEGYGDYQVYDYGGEVWTCEYCTFFQHGAAGVDLVRLTSTNSAGIASPFTTIGSGNESMTKVNLWGTWSAGGTADALAIESSGLPISQVTIGGFGNLTSASSFIRDLGAGEIHGLSLADLRVEPTCTNCKLLTLSNSVSNLKIDAQWAALSAPSVTLVSLAGQVNNADITLRPGDGQPQFPSAAVITCSGTVLGTFIHDFIKTGGGAQTNSCPGASEVFNGPILSSLTVKPGTLGSLASCASGIEGSFAAVNDLVSNGTWGATAAGGGSVHGMVYCDGSNWVVAAK